MNCFYAISRRFFIHTFLLLILLTAGAGIAKAQPDGAKLFKQNCARCHTIGKGVLTGPDLIDVASRVPAPANEWLHSWIKNNKAMIAAGDAYAVKVYNDNAKANMDVFDGVLTDEEITAVIEHMNNPPAAVQAVAEEEVHAGDDKSEEQMLFILLISAGILFVLVWILSGVRKNLQDSVNAKNGLPPSESVGPVKWASKNKRAAALIGILLTALVVRAFYIEVMEVSVYVGYKPEQPIKFSHQTHAGKLQINCVYCHSGAEKGRTSGVPSANVCMNCHKAINEGPKTGKAEIAKIYEAVGYDPSTGKYDESKAKPIKWARVHALPDFAYFNHSQHVVAGQQDCANCHGDVASMDEAEQVSPLTMGWCIDCHRKTEVPGISSNPYYADLHAKLKEQYKGEPLTVEKIGGLDCIKCHY